MNSPMVNGGGWPIPGSAPNGDDDMANIKLFQAEPAVRIIFTLQNNKAQIQCTMK